MSQSTRKPLRWCEPIRFNRRQAIREVVRMKWALLRWTAYGLIAAFTFHIIVVTNNLAPQRPMYVNYAHLCCVPVVLLACFMCQALVPRGVTVRAKYLMIQIGLGAEIPFGSIHTWKICALNGNPANVVLLVKYTNRKGRRRRIAVGISPKIDLVKLDERMRLYSRLARLNTT